MTDIATHEDRPARISGKSKPGKSSSVTAGVSGYALARHLSMSRQGVDALAVAGVIQRGPDGLFDEAECRARYIAHLRSERRGSARSEADAAFTAAKTRLIEMRVQEKQREMIPIDEAVATTDAIVGIMLTAMGSMPARIGGHDLAARRKIEQIIFEVRTEIADAASALADQRGEPQEDDAA